MMLPDSVIVSGKPCSSCLEWRRLLPLLEQAGAAAWAVDLLGWGFCDAKNVARTFSVAAKREHLYEFWRQHIGQSVVVVGPSLGGAAAIDFALTHPDAVAKLCLIDAQAFTEGVGNMATLPRVLAYAGVNILKSIPLRSYANVLAYWNGKLATDDAMRVGRLHCLQPGWSDAMVSFMQSGGYNVAGLVPQIKQEVVVLWGENDKILAKDIALRLLEEVSNAKLHWISQCGHLPHLEQPEQVRDMLLGMSTDP
eukprot:SM000045S16196  [mRNA]  locus=s45:139664:141717:- [translate_table: standard]